MSDISGIRAGEATIPLKINSHLSAGAPPSMFNVPEERNPSPNWSDNREGRMNKFPF